MDIFAVQTYFSVHVLCFVETLLQIQPPPVAAPASSQQLQHPFTVSPPPTNDQAIGNGNGNGIGIGRDGAFDEGYRVDYDIGLGEVGGKGEGKGTAQGTYMNRSGKINHHHPHHLQHNHHNHYHSRSRNKPDQDQSQTQSNNENSTANPGRGQYTHLRVSDAFHGKTYGHLARYLIQRGAMPLGLYRPAGVKRSKLPFTHLNPDPDEPLIAWPPRDVTRDWGVHPRGFTDAGVWGEEQAGVSERGSGIDDCGEASFRPGPQGFGVFAWRGDDVFVLRSRSCPLSGEV